MTAPGTALGVDPVVDPGPVQPTAPARPPRILAGTGHRPTKIVLDGRTAYDPAVFARVVALCRALLHRTQPVRVLAGGAVGFDEALAVAALDAGIPLTLLLPFPGYDSRWPAAARARYAAIGARADAVHYVSAAALPGEPPLTFGQVAQRLMARNRALVDGCTDLAALWDGHRAGGTWQAVRYAQAQQKPILQLWPAWQRHAAATAPAPIPTRPPGTRTP